MDRRNYNPSHFQMVLIRMGMKNSVLIKGERGRENSHSEDGEKKKMIKRRHSSNLSILESQPLF